MDWSRLLSCRRAGPSDFLDGDRTEFEKDLSRVVFSTPVRRLQDKTHVFPLEQHDSVRTRLTHSLEVSSVARDLSQAAVRRLEDRIPAQYAQAISTIAASSALLHDVGNPPFGHAGERAIQDWFAAKLQEDSRFDGIFVKRTNAGAVTWLPVAQDFLQFDGNAQMMRLAGRLQILSAHNGLNLTFGTLSAACKYVVAARDTVHERHEFSKPGFFETERELVEMVQEETGTGRARNPITYLVEAADDIVNVCIDLEDGIRKRLFSWDEMIGELERGGASGEGLTLKREAETLAGSSGFAADDVFAQAFRTKLMARLIPAVLTEFQNSYDAIMAGDYGCELVRRSDAAILYNACKDVVKRRIFSSPEVLKLEIMGRRVIHDMLDLYWEGVSLASRDEKGFSAKLYSLLSDNYRQAFEQDLARDYPTLEGAAKQHYLRLRLVCDQVAGMTDAFAVRQHRSLTNA
ncbi:MAG TPA: dNTP triphosphohydrolase [Bryobacteraceae bacterium]|nr:dNTP triphosphohydrolase [Bryobacteraceae bacterium]